jgi:hypothetical protein
MPRSRSVCSLQRTALDHVFQGHAVQILHSNEGLPTLLADVIDGADVRMVQSGSSLRFALEAAERLRVFGHVIRQELERDKTVQPRVFTLVDDTHPAAAQLFDDAVVRDSLVDHVLRILRGAKGASQ